MKISFDLYTADQAIAISHFVRITDAANFDGYRGDNISLAPQEHYGRTIYCLNGNVDYSILNPKALKSDGFVSDCDLLTEDQDGDTEELDWDDL